MILPNMISPTVLAGLWELLAPVGRRVNVETLGRKKLAVDASIWLIQFIKAMRTDEGVCWLHQHAPRRLPP